MKNPAFYAFLIWVSITGTIAVGWTMNLIDVIRWSSDWTGEFIVRCIGIFVPPLGAIMGLFF